jgi:pyruvate/2-oxoglutarate/acetoin dehydrogenase E1 component
MTTYAEAIRQALVAEMERDDKVYLIGQGVPDDVGVYGTTKGLQEQFGKNRVFDMPVSENGMTGVAIGSALAGMRPVMVHNRMEFAMLAMDQICNQAAKWHYMFGGQQSVPLVIRLIVGRGWGQGPQHSQSLHAWFSHIPGLKVVAPATPRAAKGLLIAAIRDPNPVIFIEHRWLHPTEGEVGADDYAFPIGVAQHMRLGDDITIITSSYSTVEAMKAADMLASDGIGADVIDLCTLSPRDDKCIFSSVKHTHNLLVVDQGFLSCGYAADVVAVAAVTENCFDALQAAPARITLPDAPTPTTRALTNYYYPNTLLIYNKVRQMLGLQYSLDSYADVEPGDKTLDVPDLSFRGPF